MNITPKCAILNPILNGPWALNTHLSSYSITEEATRYDSYSTELDTVYDDAERVSDYVFGSNTVWSVYSFWTKSNYNTELDTNKVFPSIYNNAMLTTDRYE